MIKLTTKKYMAGTVHEPSILPSITNMLNVQNATKTSIDDYEGLYIGYGKRHNCYPYREQNNYSLEVEQDVPILILENDTMYDEFLPTQGGRLWKLINKKKGIDLLYHNDVIRYRNLSTRNAWFSGGVEWNIGIIGHTPYTCESLYSAKVRGANGEEVLRIYQFDRVREVYYQLDFWLDDQKLLTRVWIQNPSEETRPMYWWSNIASPEFKGGRIIVPAVGAYNNSDGIGINKSTIPIDKGVDVSYPENILETIDYFYDIKDRSPKFIANVDSDGNGLFQYSSSRLKGRKLFSWGHVAGSYHWQEFLTDKAGDYIEIQAGLGKTQYECIPMPPKTSWSWVECYTDISLGVSVDSEYDKLVSWTSNMFDADQMDELCDSTLGDIANVKGEVIWQGNGYGYLQNIVKNDCPKHLQFLPCDESKKWIKLAETGVLENVVQTDSFLVGNTYRKLLLDNEKNNCTNWNLYYQLALIELDNYNIDKASEYVIKSMLLDNNYQNNHLYMNILIIKNDANYIYYANKIIAMKNDNFAVAEDVLKILLNAGKNTLLIDSFELLSEDVASNSRIKMYLAVALLAVGKAKEAENIIANKNFYVNDYREGDKMLSVLYKGIRMALYGESSDNIIVPKHLDFVVVK